MHVTYVTHVAPKSRKISVFLSCAELWRGSGVEYKDVNTLWRAAKSSRAM